MIALKTKSRPCRVWTLLMISTIKVRKQSQLNIVVYLKSNMRKQSSTSVWTTTLPAQRAHQSCRAILASPNNGHLPMMEAVAAQKAQTSAQLWRGPLQLAAKTLWSPFWIVASITHIATSPETFGLDQPV